MSEHGVPQPRDFIATLPRLRLTPRQFGQLSEYSCSYPTGTPPGKMWKRLDGAHDHAFRRAGSQPYWMVMQYDPAASSDAQIEAMKARGEPVPTRISILRFKPVITLRADARPSAAEVAA